MSVQDWLETKDGPVFLEGNPQGQWIFLAGSRELVPSAVAEHLLGMQTSLGQWPDAAKRLRYDFQTKKSAPANDGIEAPVFARPVWIYEVARFQGALALARDARIGAEAGAAAAEEKAGRLVQVGLALLTITLALGAYQASFSFSRSWMWDFSLLPAIAALSMIALATLEAQQVDRVGMYGNPNPEDLAARADGDDDAAVLASEYQGLQLARWTSNHKHTDLMTAARGSPEVSLLSSWQQCSLLAPERSPRQPIHLRRRVPDTPRSTAEQGFSLSDRGDSSLNNCRRIEELLMQLSVARCPNFGSSGIDVGHSTHFEARDPLVVKGDPGTGGQ